MLNPNNDRLDYARILAAPDGFRLDFAIGTTYSLDLDALVGACLALGLSAETDSDLMKNPICLLEALRGTGDKVALFCEGGQIHLPGKVTSLYILLEQMVYPVSLVKPKGASNFPSFHPKFWLIRYVDNRKNPLYRVVILSRNLTFDRSWDVAFYMDGTVTEHITEKNQPVADFLRFLARHLGTEAGCREKAKKIRAIIRELPTVTFEIGSKDFYDFDFLPTGIPGSDGGRYSILHSPLFSNFPNAIRGDGLKELLVMSPFLSKEVISYFNGRIQSIKDNENILITRAMSLEKLSEADCSQFEIYTMKDAILEGESAISEGNGDAAPANQDIHAKLYFTRKNSNSELYLGSLNASCNAIYKNVEFMICLHSKKLDLEKFKSELFCGEEGGAENPFQFIPLETVGRIDGEESKSLSDLDAVIKEINRGKPTATITKDGEYYTVQIRFGKLPEKYANYKITVSPLLTDRFVELGEEVVFSALPFMELSVFYSIRVCDGEETISRVIKIPTTGMPENREQAVVSSVVHDRNGFYRYVLFLLGDNFVLSAMEANAQAGSDGSAFRAHPVQFPALYEKMLQTAASAPERFQEIDNLLNSLSDDGIVPKDFEDVYRVFRKAVKP